MGAWRCVTPFNLPTVTTGDISYGPGRVYYGPVGSTPSTDIGSITEDGVTLSVTAEKREIVQGNPKVTVLTFTMAQAVEVKVTGIEYNQNLWTFAIGSGNTTASADEETWSFGGDPAVTQLALMIEHQMAETGNTLEIRCWKVQSNAGVEMGLIHEEHKFPYAWKCIQADTNWAGATLNQEEQLVQIARKLQ